MSKADYNILVRKHNINNCVYQFQISHELGLSGGFGKENMWGVCV